MQQLITKSYARMVPENEVKTESTKLWYLPHFNAVHMQKPGKIRIVFDAASRSNGKCLNSFLMTGPDLLTSLGGVLIQFRQRAVAFTGDITEMFPQIMIKREDWPAQRFLWVNDDGDIAEYEMIVLMFGPACSPFSAQFVKNCNATDLSEEYTAAVSPIKERCYMDDYLDSCDTDAEAELLIQDVTTAHKKGGFCIGKWVTNSKMLHSKLTKNEAVSSKDMCHWSDITTERVLGLHWNNQADCFTFRVNLTKAGDGVASGEKVPTKREILRLVMLIFDPLGFLRHFTVKARILLQHVWRTKLGWDDELLMVLYRVWQKWTKDVPSISQVTIPRCYSLEASKSSDVSIHVFCDASEEAYCAVSYLRVKKMDGKFDVTFVFSKTRVTPLKTVSIPRLELQAALIGSRLGKFIMNTLKINVHAIYYWTNSRTVLAWLTTKTRRFQQFVSNRVGEILENTNATDWRWLSTKDNVADKGTRSGKANLESCSRWFRGPQFLKTSEAEWPEDRNDVVIVEEELELKKEICSVQLEVPEIPAPNSTRFSSYTRLIRATAYVLKFMEKIKSSSVTPSVMQLKTAEMLVIRKCQWEYYPKEMGLLADNKFVSKRALCTNFHHAWIITE